MWPEQISPVLDEEMIETPTRGEKARTYSGFALGFTTSTPL
jgi:hypothetical protein